jgi:pSer/pThr/pTyr-binding forkhead associated (FHA) protein
MTHQTELELVAWQAGGSPQSIVVKSNQSILVGKSRNCGLQLCDPSVSDIHCRIGFERGQLWVQDWMSLTGTKVNGDPVTTMTYVSQGCVIEVGSYKIQVSKADRANFETERSEENNHHVSSPLACETESCSTASVMNNGQFSDEQGRIASQDAVDDARQPSLKIASKVETLSQADEIYDRETVELLLAEIDDLRTALAQAQAQCDSNNANACGDMLQFSVDAEESDRVLQRIQELSEEANRADERVLILEEMLHAAEDANRSEVEERAHLEAWVGDIEKRIGQRESEHAAELDALRERLESAENQNNNLQRQLQQAATTGDSAQQRYSDVMENLQQENRHLQDTLAEVSKDLRQLKQRYENQSEQTEGALREERARIAREHAEMSRLKFEYAQKITQLEELPKSAANAEPVVELLREHRQYFREMSKEKKEKQQSLSLSGRLKSIWNRVN